MFRNLPVEGRSVNNAWYRTHWLVYSRVIGPCFPTTLSHKSDPWWIIGTYTTRMCVPLLIINEFSAEGLRVYSPSFGGYKGNSEPTRRGQV